MVPNLFFKYYHYLGSNYKVKGDQSQVLFEWQKKSPCFVLENGLFEVYKSCSAHLSTQCILMVLIDLLLSFNLRCSYIVAKCRNSDTTSSKQVILPYVFASFLPGNEFGGIEGLSVFSICPLTFRSLCTYEIGLFVAMEDLTLLHQQGLFYCFPARCPQEL